MPNLDSHRKVAAERAEVISLQPPFSFFDYAEQHFPESGESLRRIFSLARSAGAMTLIVEMITPSGVVAEENQDLVALYPHYVMAGLCRFSFWKKALPVDAAPGAAIKLVRSKALAGYAILKNDVAGTVFDGWHVFEAVFSKYQHHHNCVPQPRTYSLAVCGKSFKISGILYCQQNSMSKACAQVAIRSLLSRLVPEGDVSYRRINEIASAVDPTHVPRNGLGVRQMRRIFEEFGLKYADVDYTQPGMENLRQDLPYQKYVYAGLESGGGALVGFRCTTPDGAESGHIIPIYGHTFNKDTWAPEANFAYFKIGTTAGYIPSEIWTSSFIGHDDNFGPNFCIPRLYIQSDKVDYVLEVFRPGINYSGVQAEALAVNLLYSMLGDLDASRNIWICRLKQLFPHQRLVLRAVSLLRSEYMAHLREISDWEDHREATEICDLIESQMPDYVWVVEISTPQLFPANKRKLGEIVLDGTGEVYNVDGSVNRDLFYLARLPSVYMLGGNLDENGIPMFTPVPSFLASHTDLVMQ